MYPTFFRYTLMAVAIAFLTHCANYTRYEAEIEDLTSDEAPLGKLEYSTYLVGDLGYDYERGLTTLSTMVEDMPDDADRAALMLLGDIVGPRGLRKNDEDTKAYLDDVIDRLERVSGEVYYTPGENELGRDGRFGRLERLEDYFDDHSDKDVRFMPNNACSGPDDEELYGDMGLVGVNTAWYLADWTRDEEVSEGCDYTNRDAMTFAMADEIKGYRDKVKIVMMHHPLQSRGNRGGQYSLRQHIFPLADAIPGAYLPLPIVGSLFRLIQGVGGGDQDVNSLRYQNYVRAVNAGIDDEENVIFVSGHEHNMTLIHEGEYMQIIAGTGSERGPSRGGNDANFTYGEIGYSKLDFYDDGSVYVGFYTVDERGEQERVFYRRIIKNRFAPQDVDIETVPTEQLTEARVRTTVYGMGVEDVGSGYRKLFGSHYRPLYFMPVEVPVLKIDTIFGGLDPYRRGGGMTTMSLHTEGADGRLYQLRSVRKNPAQLLPGLLENSFAADIAKDQFTAIHPYAPLALPPWQRELDLFHADPYLYYVPKQLGLTSYNTNFGGEMYWLEQRPDEDWSGTRFFGGSENIVGNDNMRELLAEDWKNYIDDNNFARARLFDFWIGDWDRHRDQWRWAEFEQDDGRSLWIPVGRDRDQVFSNFDGNLLGLARLFVPEARKLRPFGYELDNAKWRALNGKWNDRVFLNQLTREEMLAEARRIQQDITTEDIREGLLRMPPEVIDYSLEKEDIDGKLEARLEQLEEFAGAYYEILAKRVNILGTDSDDYFAVQGLDDGDVRVRVYDADKDGDADELYYERTFHPDETKAIRLYGLDGDDRFVLEGPDSPITIRIIGGTDGDETIASGKLNAKVYDEEDGMDLEGNTGRLSDRRSDNHPELNNFDFQEYYPSYTTPLPIIGFNIDDGFFAGMGFSRTVNTFKPDPYNQRHQVQALYSTNRFWTANYEAEFNDLFGRRIDLTFDGHYYSPQYVANFFGLGNEGPGQPDDDRLEELGIPEDEQLEYNRARRQEINVHPMVRFRGRRNRFSVSAGPFFRQYDLDDAPDFTLIRNTEEFDERVFSVQPFAGLALRIESNNVAVPLLADNGVKYDVYARHAINLNGDRSTTKFGGDLTFYRMLTKAINFATRIGVEFNTGDPEFYQLARLGGRTNYRAARSERYLGNDLFYQNIDLRFLGFSLGGGDVPTVGGFIVGLDHGRVWLEGEDSSVWHVGYGGGVWAAPLGAGIVSATYFMDSERGRINIAVGFPF